eukprot:scaffold1508_cov178-Amphora_coffeaeformis.AAC.19
MNYTTQLVVLLFLFVVIGADVWFDEPKYIETSSTKLLKKSGDASIDHAFDGVVSLVRRRRPADQCGTEPTVEVLISPESSACILHTLAVTAKHGWEFASDEGKPAEEATRSDTLYVTNLREPIARIVSQYKYEGRWPCGQLTRNKTHFIPSYYNEHLLEEFVSAYSVSEGEECKAKRRKKLWKCSDKCYLRWFGKDFDCLKNEPRSFPTAVEQLMSYNLIDVQEWMRNESYARDLSRMSNMPPKILLTPTSMYRGQQSAYWNQQLPPILRNDTLREMQNQNVLDTRLFNLITSCTDGVVFRLGTI